MDLGKVIAVGALVPGVAVSGVGIGIALDRALDQGGKSGAQAADAAVLMSAFTLGTAGTAYGGAIALSRGVEFSARIGGATLAAVGVGALAAIGASLIKGAD